MKFKDQIRRQLIELNREQVCQFAWLCGLRVLPFLSTTERSFAYWIHDRQKHLYAIFNALDVCLYTDDYAATRSNAAVNAAVDAAQHDAFMADFAFGFVNYDAVKAGYDAAVRAADVAQAIKAAQTAKTDVCVAQAVIAAVYAVDAARPAADYGIDLTNFFFEDIQAIKQNRLDLCNHDTNLYGRIWDNFQEDLKAVGCDYWARLYKDLFTNGFDKLDKKELERRLVGIPDEIKEQGAAAVGRYLEGLGDDAERLNEARIIILGEKGAGKTSLARKLIDINAKKVEEKESTEGVITDLWRFPSNDGVDINAHIWDFAGHSITHSAHRCFMSARCLYIYVYDGRTEHANAHEYWLEQIRIHGKDSPVLFLINEKDGHKVTTIAEKILKKEYPSIAGYYYVNIYSKDQTKLKDFCEIVKDMVCNNPSWNSQVVSLEEYKIKNALREEFTRTKSHHITFERFEEIAIDCGAKSERFKEILDNLDTLGICLWDNRPEMEEFNMLILNPDWITHGIYRIMNLNKFNKNHEENEHTLTLSRGTEILKQKDDKTYEYPREKVAYLFRLMRLYDLAFFKETDLIFIPGILPIDMPDNKMPDFDDVNDRLTMSFDVARVLPPDIVARIIVQRSDDIYDEKLLWRKGAVLRFKDGDAIALVKEETRSITMNVKGKDKTEYIKKLRETIKIIFASYQNIKMVLSYEVLIPEDVREAALRDSFTPFSSLMVKEDTICTHIEKRQPYLDSTFNEIPLDETGLAYGLYDKKEIRMMMMNGLEYLSSRLHPKAIELLDDAMLSNFSKNEETEMTVIVIDIRKSSQLKEKAINSDKAEDFISKLMEKFRTIVMNNYGVFDKFTGDGILAYFPAFYSGKDSILNCCITSQECHNFFYDFYKEHHHYFSMALDTGLGIGINYGKAKISSKINKEHTVLGNTVDTAFRFSGAPAGKTYLNITAHEAIKKYYISSKETKLETKEGTFIAYELERIIGKNISIPDWAKKPKR
jgi:GTPase SAR1 family protein/class 3 adenylate cyclase